jgi:hypothetical protein
MESTVVNMTMFALIMMMIAGTTGYLLPCKELGAVHMGWGEEKRWLTRGEDRAA